MRAVVQRVDQANVKISGETVGEISQGLLVLLGVAEDDDEGKIEKLAEKIVKLRIFSDKDGKMNLSLLDVGGQLLVVSQFTLIADAKKGNRPSFKKAANLQKGEVYYNKFIEVLKRKVIKVSTGQFGADMQVSLTNDGPVTIILDL
jgi:D-aminoacyl-tRNA deacylase